MSEVQVPGIRVFRFWTRYVQDPADASKLKGIDWVEYGNVTDDKTRIVQRISLLRDHLVPLADAAGNPAVEMAHYRWNTIEPQYEAWKTGQELPESGTPLAAWNALTPEQAELFRQNGVRTVEEIAGFSDAHINRFSDKIPRLRDLVIQAQAFIEAGDQAKIAKSIEKRDEEIRSLQDQNTENQDTIRKLMDQVNALAEMVAHRDDDDDAEIDPNEEPVKRRPGRPRKVSQPEQAA
jgi:hypothetical protein